MTADKHTEDELDRALEDPAFAELFSALRAEASRPAPPVSPQLGLLLVDRCGPGPTPSRGQGCDGRSGRRGGRGRWGRGGRGRRPPSVPPAFGLRRG